MNEWINCMNCTHYYVTWDKNFPHGCKLFAFKSGKLPSLLVLESTGDKCKNHELKKKRAQMNKS